VGSLLIKDLKFPQSQIDRMHFANVHRLPRRVGATHSSTNSTHTNPSIVVKLSEMKDKFTIYSELQEPGSSIATSSSTYCCLCSDNASYLWKKHHPFTQRAKQSNGESRTRTIVYMQMVSLFYRTDKWSNGIFEKVFYPSLECPQHFC